MNVLNVVPEKGIGTLHLGDSKEEILCGLKALEKEFGFSDKVNMQVSQDLCENGYTRYISDYYFFMVRYEDERAVEIAVNRDISQKAEVILYDMEVFNMYAEELIGILSQKSTFTCDTEDKDLAYNYEFSSIGIRLWRDGVFHPKLLEDKKYIEAMKDILEEEYQYHYFTLISVNNPK